MVATLASWHLKLSEKVQNYTEINNSIHSKHSTAKLQQSIIENLRTSECSMHYSRITLQNMQRPTSICWSDR